MTHYVYLILTLRKGRYVSYAGYTNNIENRIKLHNTSKGAKFTKGNNWILIYKKKYKSKKKAMSAEFLLKKNYKLRAEIKKNYLCK